MRARPVDASRADRPVADAPADPPAPDVTVSPDIIGDLPEPEASPPDATADLVDAPPPLVADCPAVPELALCLRFENNPIRDESPNGTAVSLTSVRVDTEVDGRAAFLTSGSKIQVAESAALASPSITIEAWVKPSALPQNDDERAAIIDYSRQYALVIQEDGEVRCRVNTGGSSYIDISRTGLLQVGIWSSIACTVHNGEYSLWHNGLAGRVPDHLRPAGGPQHDGTVPGGQQLPDLGQPRDRSLPGPRGQRAHLAPAAHARGDLPGRLRLHAVSGRYSAPPASAAISDGVSARVYRRTSSTPPSKSWLAPPLPSRPTSS